ncbi:MAG: hypothetical protein H0V89_12185 [Deltaproteobacteria bacterium]|nr:hypothetical protein [Deltaproteobacteria bacterium]
MEGPVDPAAKNVDGSRNQLTQVLAELPSLDASLGVPGWTVAWQGPIFTAPAGPLLRTWVWCQRSEAARDLAGLLRQKFEAFHFLVSPNVRPTHVDPALGPAVVYIRSGEVRVGLESRSGVTMHDVAVVEEDRADVDFGRQFRFAAQRCPKCGAVDHPAELVAGFPDSELLLAAMLGEVVFAGCDPGDRRSRKNARCRVCEADFRAR